MSRRSRRPSQQSQRPNRARLDAQPKGPKPGPHHVFAFAANMGRPGIPHEATFWQRLYSGEGKVVFYNSDEAIRQSREDAAKMLSDLTIKNPLLERIRSTALLKWHLEPEDKSDPAQSAFAKDVTKTLERVPRFIECTLVHHHHVDVRQRVTEQRNAERDRERRSGPQLGDHDRAVLRCLVARRDAGGDGAADLG